MKSYAICLDNYVLHDKMSNLAIYIVSLENNTMQTNANLMFLATDQFANTVFL